MADIAKGKSDKEKDEETMGCIHNVGPFGKEGMDLGDLAKTVQSRTEKCEDLGSENVVQVNVCVHDGNF